MCEYSDIYNHCFSFDKNIVQGGVVHGGVVNGVLSNFAERSNLIYLEIFLQNFLGYSTLPIFSLINKKLHFNHCWI